MSQATGGNADHSAATATVNMGKPAEKLVSIATMIVSSMFDDSPISRTPSHAPTPSASSADLSATLSSTGAVSSLGGSKALESLAKFVQATESFFHPSNHGTWSHLLGRFIQSLCSEFLSRWTAEHRPDCKTPKSWRLTTVMKQEFVLTLRTVALLAMYSKDPAMLMSAHSALNCMAQLEPKRVSALVCSWKC